MLKSNWQLTFSPGSSPWVLVSYGDRLDEELQPVGTGLLENTPILESPDPFLRDGFNFSYQFSFTVHQKLATDALARAAMLDQLILFATLGVAPLKLQLYGTTATHYEYAQAKITSMTPGIRPVGLGWRSLRFEITAAGLYAVEALVYGYSVHSNIKTPHARQTITHAAMGGT